MFNRVINFISSFGVITLGVFLVLGKSIALQTPQIVQSFPESQDRPVLNGGDVNPAVFFPKTTPTIPLAISAVFSFPSTTAVAAMVTDDKTDTVLFDYHSDEPRALASISKLMSALVILDFPIDWSATTTVVQPDIDQDNHIFAGEKFTLNDVWNVALVGSSNSAINVLVRATGLSEADFVDRMNTKARDLGLTSAQFSEPTGLDARNVATAKDIDQLLKTALSKEKILKTLQIGEYYAKPLNKTKLRRVWSTNWLLTRWTPNNFDIKNMAGTTGYIELSGYNFAVRLSDAKQHALRIIVLGTPTNESRFTEAKNLAEWTSGHYLWPDDEGYDKLAE